MRVNGVHLQDALHQLCLVGAAVHIYFRRGYYCNTVDDRPVLSPGILLNKEQDLK